MTTELRNEDEVRLPEGVTEEHVHVQNGEWTPKMDGQSYEAKCEACGGVAELRGAIRPRHCPYCGAAIPEANTHQPEKYSDQTDLLNAIGELFVNHPQDVIGLVKDRIGWR